MMLKSQTITQLTDLNHLSSLKSFTLLNEKNPSIDCFEPEDIHFIEKVLKREGIKDHFKLYQAFYSIDSVGLPDINISVLLSPEINLAFIASASFWDEDESMGDWGTVKQILESFKGFQDRTSYSYNSRIISLAAIDVPSHALKKRWVSFIRLDDHQVAEFTEVMSQIALETLRAVTWIGSIDRVPAQEGRVIFAPNTVHRFCSYQYFIDLEYSLKHYFRYFMFLPLFFEKHSRSKFAHNMTKIIWAHFREPYWDVKAENQKARDG